MQTFIYFLGRFHVVALHLPIGLVLLAVLAHVLARNPRHHWLQQALPLLWGTSAASAVVTVILGMMHFSEGGFSGPSASAHRNWGITFALTTVVAWALVRFRPSIYARTGGLLAALAIVMVTMTGHHGGNLTHGNTFLVEYAPTPIRALAGLSPRRAPLLSVTQADPWHDVISPMLQARCASCHNNDKQRGQLDLSTLERLQAGSENGAVVLAGDPEGSELYRRVSLPESHEDFMPAEGKTPLTAEQVELLAWWISLQMPAGITVADTTADEHILALLAGELGLAETTGQIARKLPALAPAQLAALQQERFLVRPLAGDTGGYTILNEAPGLAVDEQRLSVLQAAAQALLELDLSGSRVHDEHLASLSGLTELQVLNLANNALGDEGLAVLASLPSLEVLNLYGNSDISAAGLQKLAGLDTLKRAYIWGTGASENDLAELRQQLSGVELVGATSP